MQAHTPQAAPTVPPLLITDIEAAQLLGVSARFLQKDRSGPRRIPFIRLGKFVKYSPAVLARLANGGAA